MQPFNVNVSGAYGAPMGRPDTLKLPMRFAEIAQLAAVPLDAGGYDPGGAYWGTRDAGMALWCAWNDTGAYWIDAPLNPEDAQAYVQAIIGGRVALVYADCRTARKTVCAWFGLRPVILRKGIVMTRLPNHLFISDSDGALYDTRRDDWHRRPPLRENYCTHHREIRSRADVKATLRAGPYAWPGGYALAFVETDGDTVCFGCMRSSWRAIACGLEALPAGLVCEAETDDACECALCGRMVWGSKLEDAEGADRA